MVISQLTSGVAPLQRNGIEMSNVRSIALHKSKRRAPAPLGRHVCEVTSFMRISPQAPNECLHKDARERRIFKMGSVPPSTCRRYHKLAESAGCQIGPVVKRCLIPAVRSSDPLMRNDGPISAWGQRVRTSAELDQMRAHGGQFTLKD